jgi:hypothetical protein
MGILLTLAIVNVILIASTATSNARRYEIFPVVIIIILVD